MLGLRFPEFPSLLLETSLPDRQKRSQGFVSSIGAWSQSNQRFQALPRWAVVVQGSWTGHLVADFAIFPNLPSQDHLVMKGKHL